MSSSDTSTSDRDSYSLFDHKITNDDGVCRNCFARVYHIREYDQSRLPKSLRGVVTNDVERTTSAMTDFPPGYRTSQRRTICGGCGSDRWTILKRPVKKSTARIYAQNLTERVEEHPELSIEDDDALIEEVVRLKVDGSYNRGNNYLYDRAFNSVVSVIDE